MNNGSNTKAGDMKLSLYNRLVDAGGFHLLHNGFTGALARVDDPDKLRLIGGLLGGEMPQETIGAEDPGLHADLVRMGALIPCGFDERLYMRLLSERAMKSGDLAITAVMTYACNFRCRYCYEGDKRVSDASMGPDTVSGIQEMCRQMSPERIFVTLYGGEPLLNREMCFSLLEGLRIIEKTEVRGQIITNGYLLDEETASALAARGVAAAQVTVDGPPEAHDRKRPLADGGSTFTRVAENIESAAKHMKVAVRVNLGPGETGSYEYVKNRLGGMENVRIYPAVIRDLRGGGTAPECDILADLVGPGALPAMAPGVRIPGCAATNIMGVVVLPDGRMAKCWKEVGGSVPDGLYPMPYGLDVRSLMMIHSAWSAFNPYNPDSPCHDCRLLPSCGGGCPYDHVVGNKPGCAMSESVYERLVVERYAAVQRERGSNWC